MGSETKIPAVPLRTPTHTGSANKPTLARQWVIFFEQLVGAVEGIGGLATSTLPLTTKGDLLAFDTAPTRLAVGPDGAVLSARASAVNGVEWEQKTGVIGIVIDGGGSTPATGSKGFILVPYNCTVTGWTMIADQSGSAQITVKMSTFAAFPSTSSIVAAAPPALSSSQSAASSTLTGWTTTLPAGNVLEFHLDSAVTVQRITLQLGVTKS